MPRLHRAFALLGLLLLTESVAAEKLRLVADAWPPFTDATLFNGGLATDIVSTALARSGYASDFHQVPGARAHADLAAFVDFLLRRDHVADSVSGDLG